MKPSIRFALAALAAFGSTRLDAQELAKRVTASDGIVNVIYPSRHAACGDGRGSIQNVFGTNRSYSYDGDGRMHACVHGPARVAATVIDGEVTRLRLYVGPVETTDVRTLTVSAAEAVGWLTGVASRGSSRVASDAIVPLVVADAPDPWPFLLTLARDDNRARGVRQTALQWLSFGATDHLGLSESSRKTDDDEMREQAVFALTQGPKSESVPTLIEIARTAKNAAARRSAIFWLSQTGDPRAADVYAELLGIR
jgi:hypothetical protein